jgi:menaquinone-dependent protoporphyrinogen oxidase
MNVLVTYASKHGSTRQIASVIAEDLAETGLDVTFLEAQQVSSIAEYDVVVLGSAIYIGQWQQPVLDLIDRYEAELRQKMVWLFSSGPIGEDPFPVDEPPITSELIQRVGAVEHQSFTGKLDRGTLGFGERLITTVVRAPEGDFRDWDAIRAWATYVAESVREREATQIRSAG